jgi:nucleoid-associated protein YgaU
MKNPLVVYIAAALASLAALAGLGLTDWSTNSPNGQKVPELAGDTRPADAKVPDKAAETLEIEAPKPPKIEAETKPEPPKAEAEAKPELDTVRVESDGQAVVAGRAKPGAEIALRLGGEVIGKGIANADGSWVVVPDSPLPKGVHEITVEQKAADSAPVTAEKSIAVAIPETAGRQAMVALTEPGSATKVLQTGESQQAQGASETAEPATPEEETEAVKKPAETAQQPAAAQPQPQAQQTAEAEAVQKPETAAPAEQAQKQPAGETVAKTEELPTAVKPPETAQKQPAGETVAKTEELPTAVKPPETAQPVPEPAKVAGKVALRLDAVDYNDKGDIIFSGRAAPGTAIRLYVDNGGVGDAIVDSTGNWQFSGSDIIAAGTHTLRADQINNGGKVMARIELPFQREDAAAVAALNAPPPSETPAVQQPQTTDVQPPQTTDIQPPPATETAMQTPEVRSRQISDTQPQTTKVEPPPATETPPQQTAEAVKTEPTTPAPAPEQPATEDKNLDVTTAAATEQAAKAIEPDKPRAGKVVIQPGNNLWKLSRIIYGRGIHFTVIYKANKDQIRNPNRIYPGQIFAIPNASPPEAIDPKRKQPLTSAEGGAAQ